MALTILSFYHITYCESVMESSKLFWFIPRSKPSLLLRYEHKQLNRLNTILDLIILLKKKEAVVGSYALQ